MTLRTQAPTLLGAIASIALTATACADTPSSSSTSASVRDSAGIRIVENRVAGAGVCTVTPEPTLDIGTLEGPDEYQFYRVFDAATLSDGRIAVVNQGSSQIRLYGQDGTYLDAFGAEGDGPGEFRDVFRLWVLPGDTLLVGDYRPYRFSRFTDAGEYIGAVTPEPMYVNTPNTIEPLADGSIVAAQRELVIAGAEGEWLPVRQAVMYHRPDGGLVDTLALLPYSRTGWIDLEMRFSGSPLFEARSYVAAGHERIVIGRGEEREIQVFERLAPGPGGGAPFDLTRPVALVRWDGPDLAVTSAHVDAHRTSLEARLAEAQDDFSRRAYRAELEVDRPIADRLPPHTALRLGLEGDIWVRGYVAPGEDDPGWLVFDADGRLQCRADLPFQQTWDVYEIGRDYVLGKIDDELDVEHVRRYGLTRP